ncbi:MAG TPA: hypothetical protein VGU66_06945 [Candidatus Elarobacter sp.]|nr:hypothetical protein [Candidatus Elarobacter sp.]
MLARRLLADENGGTLVEYALVMALLSMCTLGVLAAFGQSATDSLDTSASALTQAGETVPGDSP